MKPKANRQRKERASDKDTVVAYHEFIQGRIQGELNGVTIGPGYTLSRIAIASIIFGFLCIIVGILVITLRHRHVYLVSWNDQFLGPFFVAFGLMCFGFATFLLQLAKQRTNKYRADLAFRPIGDYGVAVVHKSKLNYDDQKKSELKSGTTPHNVRHPGRPGVNDRGNRGDYSKRDGYDNRGYRDDHDRPPRIRDPEKRRDRDRDRDYHDGQGGRGDRPDRPRDRPPRREDDRRPRREGERGRRPEGDRGGRRPEGDRGGRRPDDRARGPPRGPEDERRRAEARRRYEEDKRRRQEEDRHRAMLRKQAEADSLMDRRPSEERGVDVDGARTYQIQTKVTLSRELQETDESEL